MDALEWNRGDEAYQQCKAIIEAVGKIKDAIDEAEYRRRTAAGPPD
jgi:hypothetical protein